MKTLQFATVRSSKTLKKVPKKRQIFNNFLNNISNAKVIGSSCTYFAFFQKHTEDKFIESCRGARIPFHMIIISIKYIDHYVPLQSCFSAIRWYRIRSKSSDSCFSARAHFLDIRFCYDPSSDQRVMTVQKYMNLWQKSVPI